MKENHKQNINANLNEHTNQMHDDETTHSYICETCGEKFTGRKTFKRHLANHFGSLRKYKCAVCKKRYYYKHALVRHLKELHLKQGTTCATCGKEFSRKSNLKTHEQNIHGETVWQCFTCNNFYSSKDCLRYHIRKQHIETKSFACAICGETFSDKRKLNKHEKNYHSDVIKISLYECDLCPAKYELKCGLVGHMKLHASKTSTLEESNEDEEKRLKCYFCVKSYVDKNSLKFHISKNHIKEQLEDSKTNHPGFVCCGKTLENRVKVMEHVDLHLMNDKIQCNYCNRMFSGTRHLKYHINRMHESDEVGQNNDSQVCTTCGKNFSSKALLIKHQMSDHDEDPRVQCLTCQKWFPNENDLEVHILRFHTNNQRFTCDVCSKECSSKKILRVHIHSVHMKHPFKCKYCPKTFLQSIRLKEHTAIHTGVSLYTCPYCSNKHFKNRNMMYIHFRDNHRKEWETDKKKYGRNAISVLKYKKN